MLIISLDSCDEKKALTEEQKKYIAKCTGRARK
jgi:hypothetical protein